MVGMAHCGVVGVSGRIRSRVGLPGGYVEAEVMNEHDIKAVIGYFKSKISEFGEYPNYYEIRESVNRLVGFVEVLEKELRDGQSR